MYNMDTRCDSAKNQDKPKPQTRYFSVFLHHNEDTLSSQYISGQMSIKCITDKLVSLITPNCTLVLLALLIYPLLCL